MRVGTFARFPKRHWQDSKNQKAFLETVGRRLDIYTYDNWYTLTFDDITQFGGDGIKNIFGRSIAQCLASNYPHHQWKPWRFTHSPNRYWSNTYNQRDAFEEIAQDLDVKLFDGWYDVTVRNVHDKGGRGILNMYGDSLAQCLQTLYPEYAWQPWRFLSAPQGYWSDINNRHAAIDDIARRLDVKQCSDWYKVTLQAMCDNYGRGILNVYGNSFVQCMTTLFPDFKWNYMLLKYKADVVKKQTMAFESLRRNLPKTRRTNSWVASGFRSWDREVDQKAFLWKLKESLNINSPDLWYRVSARQIKEYGGSGLLSYWPQVLGSIEPNYPWRWKHFSRQNGLRIQAKQRLLVQCISTIFPDTQVIEEGILELRRASQVHLSVDVYVPEYNLAFEYQGEQHYGDSYITGHYGEVQKIRDLEKKQQCESVGICLIAIPYWWEGDLDTIAATINHFVPTLRLSQGTNAEPILETLNGIIGDSSLMSCQQIALHCKLK